MAGSRDEQNTRQHAEQALLARLEFARAQYRKLSQGAIVSNVDSADTLENVDGALALKNAHSHLTAANVALAEYKKALKDFSDFAISGKMPDLDMLE